IQRLQPPARLNDALGSRLGSRCRAPGVRAGRPGRLLRGAAMSDENKTHYIVLLPLIVHEDSEHGGGAVGRGAVENMHELPVAVRVLASSREEAARKFLKAIVDDAVRRQPWD